MNCAANSASVKSKVIELSSTYSPLSSSVGASGEFIWFSFTKKVNLPSAVLLLPYSSHRTSLHTFIWCNIFVSAPVKLTLIGNLEKKNSFSKSPFICIKAL